MKFTWNVILQDVFRKKAHKYENRCENEVQIGMIKAKKGILF